MDEIDYTIETFGRSMNINDLRFNRHNVVFLDVERMGALLIERIHGDLLVYLAIAMPPYQKDVYARALQLCHFKKGMPLDVSVAYQNNERLILAIRLCQAEVTMDRLSQSIRLLFYLYENITDG